MPAQSLSQLRQSQRQFARAPGKVALVAVFTALSLGTNYLMIDIPNVKLMDALIFVAAFLFGLEVGLGSAVSVWTIYGFVNPYGQDDFILLFFLIVGECFYAIAGALLSRASITRDLLYNARQYPVDRTIPPFHQDARLPLRNRSQSRLARLRVRLDYLKTREGRLSLLFGLVGFQATFAYDVLTNFASYFLKTSSVYQAFIIGMITGVPFAILHEGSNILFFATVVPLAIASSKRMGLTVEGVT